MRKPGLATRIALPFIILFAALFGVAAVVVAYEVLTAMETQVERELSFILQVAGYPRFRPTESFLRGIRDRVRRESDKSETAGNEPLRGTANGNAASGVKGDGEKMIPPARQGVELAVLRAGRPPLCTRSGNTEKGRAFLADLLKTARRPGENGFPGIGEDAEVRTAYRVLGGEEYLVAYRANWRNGQRYDFFAFYPRAEIAAAQQNVLRRIIGLSALGLILAALLGRLTAGRISRPVRRLAAVADRLAGSGLDEPVELETAAADYEIGRLAAAFRAMVESLRASQRELVRNERLAAVGRLAASVAHEVRNPLTAMRMIVQTLRDRPDENTNEKTRAALRLLAGEIDRLAFSVDELLTFARPRPPRRRPTDLNRLVHDTLAVLDRQFRHAGVEVFFEPDETLPTDLALDPDKIRQLLLNLLLNALQAVVRNGKVTVRATCSPEQSSGREVKRTVVLEVGDDGPGIPPEIRDRLFEPFASTKNEGGGLGLAVVKQVTEEHGGTISFTTTTAEESSGNAAKSKTGTNFTVVLPGA